MVYVKSWLVALPETRKIHFTGNGVYQELAGLIRSLKLCSEKKMCYLSRDAPRASYSRDCRAAGNAAGFAGARGGAGHAGLQWHVLLAAWLASSCASTELFAAASEG